MNCVHCEKPIRQATLKELNQVWGPELAKDRLGWYKHTTDFWSCSSGKFSHAEAPFGTKWIGHLPPGALEELAPDLNLAPWDR
jgi:hypothetical protein